MIRCAVTPPPRLTADPAKITSEVPPVWLGPPRNRILADNRPGDICPALGPGSASEGRIYVATDPSGCTATSTRTVIVEAAYILDWRRRYPTPLQRQQWTPHRRCHSSARRIRRCGVPVNLLILLARAPRTLPHRIYKAARRSQRTVSQCRRKRSCNS